MSNFDACLAFTLKWEGGYVDNRYDPGGPTNMGITIPTLSHELGRRATRTDVALMSRETAASIYRKSYWAAINGDRLPDGVDLMAFDIAVNMGPGRALRYLHATEGLSPRNRLVALDRKRRHFWSLLPTFHVFGLGWMRREAACFAAAKAMVS